MKVGHPFERDGSWFYPVETSDGELERGPYKDERTARACRSRESRRAEKAAKVRSIAGDGFPEWDGTLDWYQRAMAVLVQKVIAGGTADQRNDLRAISDAARTAKMLYDQSDLERRVKAIEDGDRALEAERQHAIRKVRPGDDRT